MVDDIEHDVKAALDVLGKGNGLTLDVGTGKARMAYGLSKYGYNVVSIENDKDILKCARENLRESDIDKGVLLINGDAHSMPFLDDTFDAVVTYNAMHHMLDYKKALDEMVRVCKPGGNMLITELTQAGKERVEAMHKLKGMHHEAKISIDDIIDYLLIKHNIKGTIHHTNFIDILYCTSINKDKKL